MPDKFKYDYLVFDKFGIKQVLCLSCGVPIKTRVEVRSSNDSRTIIRELAKHADYKEIPVILDTKQIAFIMVCDNCKFVEIGEREAEKISIQLNHALEQQLEFEGKLPDLIEAIMKEKNFVVKRKAEVPEVVAVLKGA